MGVPPFPFVRRWRTDAGIQHRRPDVMKEKINKGMGLA